MRNITFSADEHEIDHARALARLRGRTLNDDFREWLHQYNVSADGEAAAQRYRELMKRLRHIKVDRHFTRDEMNER